MFNIAALSSSTSEAKTANQKQTFENEILKWRRSASLKPLQQRNYWLQNVFHSYENQRVNMSPQLNKKSDMSVEAITDAKHEYFVFAEKRKENSTSGKKEKKIRKKRTDRNTIRNLDCIRRSRHIWSQQNECWQEERNAQNAEIPGTSPKVAGSDVR